MNPPLRRAILITLLILIADQSLKVWVKLNMYYDASIPLLGNKGYLHFIENPGMAFGLVFGGETGKLILTLGRIVIMLFLGAYLWRSSRQGASFSLILPLSMIFAGALGNIIDSTVYGVVFSESTHYELARFMPAEGGYASVFHGRVVDMFYFPLLEGRFPEWLPIWGGEHYLFFRPVFNIADSAITVGVVLLILLQKNFGRKDNAGPVIDPESISSDAVVTPS